MSTPIYNAEHYLDVTAKKAIDNASRDKRVIASFTIPGRLPGYNELTKGHWAERAEVKKHGMELVAAYARQAGIRPVKGRVALRIQCYEKDRRRDMDNVVSGAAKCVFDALKNMGIIKGDGQKYVKYEPLTPRVDRDNPRLEMTIMEAQ